MIFAYVLSGIVQLEGVVKSPIYIATVACQTFDVQQVLLQAWQITKSCTSRAFASQRIWLPLLSHLNTFYETIKGKQSFSTIIGIYSNRGFQKVLQSYYNSDPETKKGLINMINPFISMARLARFERATYGLEVRCSIQLSYRRNQQEWIFSRLNCICP